MPDCDILVGMYSLAEKERILSSQIRNVLLRCRDIVHSDYPNAEIILYGSQATGQAQPESDVDLLVLLDEEVSAGTKRHIHDLLYDIAVEEEVVISSIIKSSRRWNLPISRATLLYEVIQEKGIKVA
jgi:predicted nucleotidyltransferase